METHGRKETEQLFSLKKKKEKNESCFLQAVISHLNTSTVLLSLTDCKLIVLCQIFTFTKVKCGKQHVFICGTLVVIRVI